MKPLPILGFAVSLSFLTPLAQAAPVFSSAPEPDRASGWHAAVVPKYPQDDGGTTIVEETPAPDTGDSQDSAPADDDQPAAPTDDSCGQASSGPAHYSMDDLVNAMQDLDSTY